MCLPDRPALPYVRELYALNGYQTIPAMSRYQITGLIVLWTKGKYSLPLVYEYQRRSREEPLC